MEIDNDPACSNHDDSIEAILKTISLPDLYAAVLMMKHHYSSDGCVPLEWRWEYYSGSYCVF